MFLGRVGKKGDMLVKNPFNNKKLDLHGPSSTLGQLPPLDPARTALRIAGYVYD